MVDWKYILRIQKKDLMGIILKFFKILLAIASLAAIPSFLYSYKSFILQRDQIRKASAPFFKYHYSEESKAFLVESENNVNIYSINWFLPKLESYSVFTKNSSSLKTDEIFFNVWDAISKKINIPLPDYKNVYDYIRCNILAEFDQYNSGIDKDAGYPLGVQINYSEQGGNKSQFKDVVLINDFDNDTPEIQIIKTNVNDDDIHTYMEKGAERLAAVLPIYPYNQIENYLENNKCTRTFTSWKEYPLKP